MQNAEGNPSQAQQNEMAAKSPVKTPATGTVGPDAAKQAEEFGKTKHAGSAEPGAADDNSPLPSFDESGNQSAARDSGDPVQRASGRIRSVDSDGMESTDDTVDADAKSIEASRDLSGWHDNVISSNATLSNNVPAPAAGLGGIDSRPTGNMPSILPKQGYRVVMGETEYDRELNGSKTSHVFTLERTQET
ncbi:MULTISPECIES: DUF3005 domain-containing protein [unclassified Caballeronia]|uniref:DUF3005 domain-containing protein n=1 Tax=unclassified Caballeronia TaxID=2646786 RepID=UPI0028541F7D|nr:MULTISPECIES: DUF3005 domain-containing protein [unclassified Caballeronia]MDR5741320.1 DUF3005 domain-containing protein [Caballeronia sp. LZ016]MDR5807217.1 DUF3005 domain-containing protein [Caballeronia sp. LZ019]